MTPERERRRNNRRTAWVVGSIAVAFFLGIMLKYVMLK
jgi:hypothetical protein